MTWREYLDYLLNFALLLVIFGLLCAIAWVTK